MLRQFKTLLMKLNYLPTKKNEKETGFGIFEPFETKKLRIETKTWRLSLLGNR